MEHSQLSQMVTWLDQAHQRDRAELNELRQQMDMFVGERAEKIDRIQELESELATLHAEVNRLSNIEKEFARFKEQVNLVLERGDTRRQQAIRDGDRLRQAEVDNLTKAIGDVRKEVERFRRYDEELAARRVDFQRITGEISLLQQQVSESVKDRSEWARSSSFLEEQRRQDAKRLADFQSQVTDVLKRIESVSHKIQYLEQYSVRLNELKGQVDNWEQQQTKDVERIQFVEAQHERQVRTWSQEIEGYRQRMEEYERRMEQYGELPHNVKQALDGLQGFREQVERQQHETNELMRLAENHQKNQLEEWKVEDEQRWQKYLVEWERQLSDYDKSLNELIIRVSELEERSQASEKRLNILLQLAEEDAESRAMAARDWQLRFEQMAEEE